MTTNDVSSIVSEASQIAMQLGLVRDSAIDEIRQQLGKLSDAVDEPVEQLIWRMCPSMMPQLKYRDPDNPFDMWDEKGKEPDWYAKKIQEGYSTQDLLNPKGSRYRYYLGKTEHPEQDRHEPNDETSHL